jgi:plasmid stabilization system protein ParE
MQLEFLQTAQPGLRWFYRYYRENPQLRKEAAYAAFRKARALVKANPYLGHPHEDAGGVREIAITGTNFSMLYTVARDTILVIDLRDARGTRSADALRAFTAELRSRDLG